MRFGKSAPRLLLTNRKSESSEGASEKSLFPLPLPAGDSCRAPHGQESFASPFDLGRREVFLPRQKHPNVSKGIAHTRRVGAIEHISRRLNRFRTCPNGPPKERSDRVFPAPRPPEFASWNLAGLGVFDRGFFKRDG